MIGKEIKEFYGGAHSHAALTAATGIIVCTIEKANIMWVQGGDHVGSVLRWPAPCVVKSGTRAAADLAVMERAAR